MSKPELSNAAPSNQSEMASREHHGWLAWLPWWLPMWVPVVTLGGVLLFAAGMYLVVANLIHI